jgi:hypothetical protein
MFKHKKTKLDQLLESIDPAVTLEQVSSRVDEAINSFNMESGIIQKWDDFKKILEAFHWYVKKTILLIRPSHRPDPDIEWGRCCEILLKEYGPNGEKAAMEIARTGKEGGLYKILKKIAKRMIEEYAGNEIRARISHYWYPLSTEQKLAATEEYLGKYGHLLPSELTEGTAVRIKVNFMRVLEQHPHLIMRLRKVGKE